MRHPERREDEARREGHEERPHLRLPVEAGHGPGQRDPRAAEDEPEADPRPERRRPVRLRQLAPLHERRAEREPGEDRDDPGEDEHHPGDAVVLRGEEPGEDDRDDELRELDEEPRCALPGDAPEDAAAQVGRGRRGVH